jgi:leucyl-tRNA synthetase
MDPKNKSKFADPKKEKYWSPVDFYVGGAEHATRHLIYARFWHKFLFDIGVVSTIEPFIKLQHVGLIMGADGRKMSKRFGNVVNPDDVVNTYGADTLRLYEMFMGPFDQQIAWSTESIVGVRRFLERIWKLRFNVDEKYKGDIDNRLNSLIHKAVKKVTDDIGSMAFNTAISHLMITVNEIDKLQKADVKIDKKSFETLLKILAPFAPHICEELWYSLGNKKSINISSWPTYEDKYLIDDNVTIAVQVNGKMRGTFESKRDEKEEILKSKALALESVVKWLEGREPKKIIVIKNKLISIVV